MNLPATVDAPLLSMCTDCRCTFGATVSHPFIISNPGCAPILNPIVASRPVDALSVKHNEKHRRHRTFHTAVTFRSILIYVHCLHIVSSATLFQPALQFTMTHRNRLAYVYSCDLTDVAVQVKIVALDGQLPSCVGDSGCDQSAVDTLEQCAALAHLRPSTSATGNSDAPTLFAHVQVYSDGRAIGQPVITSHRPLPPQSASGDGGSVALMKQMKWNEWVTLPVKYS